MDIKQLNSKYGIAGQLKFVMGSGGFPFVLICNKHATALISVYAAQVLSFQPAEESEDLLFLSQKAYYEDGKAIRGGIPVCWPWFGPDPIDLKRPNHGFVRNGLWEVSETKACSDFETMVKLKYLETVQNKSYWKKAFALELDITIGKTLTMELITRNTGNTVFSITQAFHAYFKVGNIKQVRVLGLENTRYFDQLDESVQKNQMGAVTVSEEVERIYTDIKNELTIDDSAFNRRIQIASNTYKTVVVWNPWATKSEKMPDLQHNDYQHFICVETGNVVTDIVEIKPDSEYSLITNFKITRD